jgi:anti-sigma factor RsiW
MPHPDEGTIHAWLDGALPPDESARVEAHTAECATCAAAVAEARGLIAASSRILTALDDVPGQVVPAGDRVAAARAAGAARAIRRPRFRAARYTGIAAAIAFVAATVVVLRDRTVSKDTAAFTARASDSTAETSLLRRPSAPAEPQAANAPEAAARAAQPSPSPRPPERRDAEDLLGSGVASGAPAITGQVAGAERATDRTADVAATPPPSAPSSMIVGRGAARMKGVEMDSRAQLAQITGRVTDSSGAPIPSAQVTVAGTNSAALTDQDGSFRIANVPAGTQTVEARQLGYATEQKKVEAAPGDTVLVDLALGAAALQLGEVVTSGAATKVLADTVAEREIAGLTLLNTSESLESGRPVRRSLYQLRPGVTITLVERRARADESGAPATTSPQGMTQPRRAAADERRRLERSRRSAEEAPQQINTIFWTSTDGTEFTLTGAVTVTELEDVRRRIERQ